MSGFSYSGPSLAAMFVAGVFNDAEQRATQAAQQSGQEFGVARAVVSQAPESLAAKLTRQPTITPPTIDMGALLARNSELDGVLDRREGELGLSDLVGKVDEFLTSYFPGVDAAVASARSGLMALFGGSNFANGKQAARLRMRLDEARTFRALEGKEDELMRRYADLNYPLPPGMLVHELTELRAGQLHEMADRFLEVDATELARERENLERALRLLVSGRAQAIQAFGSYLASACAARYAVAIAQTEAAYAESQLLTDAMYQQLSGVSRAAALQIRAGEVDHQLAHGYLAQLDTLAQQQTQAQLQAATAMAKVLGTQAATAYNNMRGSASVSSSEAIDEL